MDENKELPFVSVIIPSNNCGPQLERCLNSLVNQNYPHEKVEIIIVFKNCNTKIEKEKKGIPINLINGGKANPAEARNIAIDVTRGDIIAMVDDDCIVEPYWISKAIQHFYEPMVAVVGGPGIPFREKPTIRGRCTDYILSSFFGSVRMQSRYKQSSAKVIECLEDRLILCNMFARRTVLQEVGGFDGAQVPCEENELNHRLSMKGYKLLYDPNLLVYHRVRPLFWQYAFRLYNYAIGRGIMSARCPSTFRFVFAIPSLFVLMLIFGIPISVLSLFNVNIFMISLLNTSISFSILVRNIFLSLLVLYFGATFAISLKASIDQRDLRFLFVLPIGYFIHHFFYGLGFMVGIYRYLRGTWRANKL